MSTKFIALIGTMWPQWFSPKIRRDELGGLAEVSCPLFTPLQLDQSVGGGRELWCKNRQACQHCSSC